MPTQTQPLATGQADETVRFEIPVEAHDLLREFAAFELLEVIYDAENAGREDIPERAAPWVRMRWLGGRTERTELLLRPDELDDVYRSLAENVSDAVMGLIDREAYRDGPAAMASASAVFGFLENLAEAWLRPRRLA